MDIINVNDVNDVSKQSDDNVYSFMSQVVEGYSNITQEDRKKLFDHYNKKVMLADLYKDKIHEIEKNQIIEKYKKTPMGLVVILAQQVVVPVFGLFLAYKLLMTILRLFL
jgi:hypothetical protein